MSEQTKEVREAIEKAIAQNEVILFMKGTPERTGVRILGAHRRGAPVTGAFAAVDVLPDPRIRQELSALSQWPTIPQLFVRGELVGGCDIVTEMYRVRRARRAARRRGHRRPGSSRARACPGPAAGHREPPLTDNRSSLPRPVAARTAQRPAHRRGLGRWRPVAGLAATVDAIRSLQPQPDAVLISGDLVDNAADSEYARLRELLSPLRAPVYVLPGNHDERGALRRNFGLPGAGAEPVQYSVDLNGELRLVVVDSLRPGEDSARSIASGSAGSTLSSPLRPRYRRWSRCTIRRPSPALHRGTRSA